VEGELARSGRPEGEAPHPPAPARHSSSPSRS
jgi:hypothetical protein